MVMCASMGRRASQLSSQSSGAGSPITSVHGALRMQVRQAAEQLPRVHADDRLLEAAKAREQRGDGAALRGGAGWPGHAATRGSCMHAPAAFGCGASVHAALRKEGASWACGNMQACTHSNSTKGWARVQASQAALPGWQGCEGPTSSGFHEAA